VIIQAEKAKNIIERIGPLKFRYQTANEIRNKNNNKILILESRLPISSFSHLRNGPNIIPSVMGIIKGERIELKKGAPTDILLLKTTLEKRG
tara:strand:- start:187 stop:462 length:276 start_codon:yes stop_codon:yes gene_type:complete